MLHVGIGVAEDDRVDHILDSYERTFYINFNASHLGFPFPLEFLLKYWDYPWQQCGLHLWHLGRWENRKRFIKIVKDTVCLLIALVPPLIRRILFSYPLLK